YDGNLDGPCEVCHTNTSYHTNSGDGVNHFDGTDCLTCHPHFTDDIVNYFQPNFIGAQAHLTHFTDPKGPLLGTTPDCTVCHYPPNFKKFGSIGDALADTGVCDPCHSPDGTFDGSAEGKAKWEEGVYESNGYELKTGNQDWCATCHDEGTSVVGAVSAPNVMGDNSTYAYRASGHGFFGVDCQDCHDLALRHIDGDPRTYEVDEEVPVHAVNPYKASYRLDGDMTIPREGGIFWQMSFRLCFDNCHIFSEVFGDDDTTNFRDKNAGLQYHKLHLDSTAGFETWDSDWDGKADTGLSCPACHNVHGSPTPVMTRHGELVSTPGTTDKVPALDFRWYKVNGTTQTTLLAESRYGALQGGGTYPAESPPDNHVCKFCHDAEELRYYRTPKGVAGVRVINVWTTDLNNIVDNSFGVGEDVRFHVSFEISGPDAYFIQSPGRKSKAYNTSGADWEKKLKKSNTLSEGSYVWTWDKTIPTVATPGSEAKAKVQIKIFDAQGGNTIDKQTKFHTFSIAP
ncbi:MAG: hypothetical protein JRF64_05920, partial [Deltaproteobacteria bacterium]|nr:hypothetical protein [Deltaproteobacteria bacterium]